MATLGTNLKTLVDRAKSFDPNGKEARIAELLSQSNEFLADAVFKEGNLPTGEQATIRTGLPTTYWRMYNAGTPTSKATSAQITFNCGNLSARSHVDRDIAELNGNVKEFRMNESFAFLEAMSQEMASTAFYGSNANPEEFVGLGNTYTSTSAGNGQNILLAGGASSDNTSVYLIGWSPETIYMTYPKGSVAGLRHEDLGLDDVEDSNGYVYRAYKDEYTWKSGLVVKDWRYGVRIANIDVSDLVGLSGAQEVTDATFLPKLMSRALARIPKRTGIKLAFYCNRTIASLLQVAAMEKSSSALAIQPGLGQFGEEIFTLRFMGVPIRITDALINTESVIS